jgi:allantoin racemase
MRKIVYISGGLGPLSPSMERVQKVLGNVVASDTIIDVYGGMVSLESRVGTYEPRPRHPIESEYDLLNSFPPEVGKFIEAEKEGYQAAIMNCSGDPGLPGIREAVSIPIIGPGVTGRHVTSQICHKFMVLTTGKKRPVNILLEHEEPHNLGRWVSTRRIGLGVLEVSENPERAYDAMLVEARKAMSEEGADAITYGCMSMAFIDFDKRLEADLGVPFMNPAKASVKIAELCIDLELTHSKLTYPTPEKLANKH